MNGDHHTGLCDLSKSTMLKTLQHRIETNELADSVKDHGPLICLTISYTIVAGRYRTCELAYETHLSEPKTDDNLFSGSVVLRAWGQSRRFGGESEQRPRVDLDKRVGTCTGGEGMLVAVVTAEASFIFLCWKCD